MGLYCFLLPHTPPAKNTGESNASLRAISEAKRQPLLTLFLIAIPVSMVHQFYFVHTSDFLTMLQNNKIGGEGFSKTINSIFGVGGGGLMTIGQMAEIVVLAAMPFVAKNVSRKSLLIVGLLAYAARMALFAHMDESLLAIIFALTLHGLCFGVFHLHRLLGGGREHHQGRARQHPKPVQPGYFRGRHHRRLQVRHRDRSLGHRARQGDGLHQTLFRTHVDGACMRRSDGRSIPQKSS